MNTFTRRSFLKGILALAGTAALPVETIQAIHNQIALPDKPIFPDNPAGWIDINGIRYSCLELDIERQLEPIYVPDYLEKLPYVKLPKIDINACIDGVKDFSNLFGKNIPFVLKPKDIQLVFSGNGYFQWFETDYTPFDIPVGYTSFSIISDRMIINAS